jgi:hypothetical protein
LNTVFLKWMGQLQKCVQVDGEYVEWAKRTQYIEIDFNREICLCYTWRRTPYISSLFLSCSQTDSSLSPASFCCFFPLASCFRRFHEILSAVSMVNHFCKTNFSSLFIWLSLCGIL